MSKTAQTLKMVIFKEDGSLDANSSGLHTCQGGLLNQSETMRIKGDLRKVNNFQNGQERQKCKFAKQMADLNHFIKIRGETQSVLDF